jgi:hypothetical protein
VVRINLISSPRNISTALMYSFAQRADTKVVDEPFYGYYLSIRAVDHPGRDEIIAAMDTNQTTVVDSLLGASSDEVLFIKNMAHHLIDIEERFLLNVTNVFLIRNPRQLIASFAQVIAGPTMNDICVRKQYELFRWLQDKGRDALVLDSGELLKDPGGVLGKLCSQVNLTFEPCMLSWKPGPRPEDGIWAKYWYANVHRSSGFEVQPTSSRPLPDFLLPLCEEAMPMYKTLFDRAIRAKD